MPSRKKESDGLSSTLGATKSSEIKRSSTFSLSRLLPSRRRSKSRLSLDSDPTRADTAASIQLAPCRVEISQTACSQSSLPPHLPSNELHHANSFSSPVVQVHSSAVSCHSQDEGNRLFLSGGSQNTASADCLLGSSSGLSNCGCDSTGGGSVNSYSVREKIETGQMSRSDTMECPVCFLEKPKDVFPFIHTCHHRSCSCCLKQYFRIEIMESRVSIACPECSELFHPNDIKAIVEDDILVQKYEDFMLRRVLAIDPDTRWCPAPDCGFAVIATGCASCPKLKCERSGCNTYFCYHCKQYWHPNQTCDAARAERSPNIRSVSVSYSQESASQNEIKSCPRCGAFIIKMDDESCNHMTCAVCEAHFCWLCLKEVSDLHYLSPSGCTFWGRKQWTRKKKILWQLGILVGAPVGITLVAGLAVPAMIIGIPVWVGKKIHYRYELASKRKRNLAITGSVTASILAAPVIATLAVGIGVPILLTYIYGVVPISLCRSGGCGVTTTNSGGVRFEFDEGNESNPRATYSYAGDNQSMETGPNVANPSIAPSIGDASLGMTNSLSASGSHMDRVGMLRDDSDRDSSSHRAIAGTSINGSLCSATYSSQHHKLEVHADISEHGVLCERSSMGGESYNMSLNDDASTRALAGSIISPKDKDGVSVCSRLFDGNGNVTSAPLVYPEEIDENEVGGPGAACSSGHRPTSSSCPTSPNLRKASSPAPSEDNKSTRSKKCTRFMDQVSEIDDIKCDSGSMGSMMSEGSTTGLSDLVSSITTTATSVPPTFSTLSLTSATTSIAPVLNSCQSLSSEGSRSDNIHCLGQKAESTSVLMDSVESRRYEMAGNSCKSDTISKRYTGPDGCQTGSLGSSKYGGRRGDKDHGSQPINLSDISEVCQGMPIHQIGGCHDLLSAVNTSDKVGMLMHKGASRKPLHCQSISSSSSSSVEDSMSDFVSSRRFSHRHLLGSSLEGVEEDLPTPSLTSADVDQSSDQYGSCCLTDVDIEEKRPQDRSRAAAESAEPTAQPGEPRGEFVVLVKESEPSHPSTAAHRDSISHSIINNKSCCSLDSNLPEVDVASAGKFYPPVKGKDVL